MIGRIRKAMEEREEGFTLIELLVVMLIIGILAAIAIPLFLNQKNKAYESSLKSDLHTVATEVTTAQVDSPTSLTLTAGTGSAITETINGDTTNAKTINLTAGNTLNNTTGDFSTDTWCVSLVNSHEPTVFWKISAAGGTQTLALGGC